MLGEEKVEVMALICVRRDKNIKNKKKSKNQLGLV